MQLTELNNNTTIDASIGDMIEIRLKTNPSTGFMWTQENSTAGVIDKLVYDPHVPGAKIGASTFVTIFFKITDGGEINLFYVGRREPSPGDRWFNVLVKLT